MTFGELLSWTLWDATRKRKLVGAMIIAGLPPLLSCLVYLSPDGFNPGLTYGAIYPLSVQQFTLVLLCIMHGTNIVSGEVSGRTISFIVTRPTPRVRIFLARWVGGTILVSALTIISAILVAVTIYGPSEVANSPILRDVMIIPIGVAVYMAVFACLSALLTRPAIPAIAYVFAFESWVWLVPGDFVKLSIMTYVRTLSMHEAPGSDRGLAEMIQQLQSPEVTATMSWNALAFVLIASLAIGALAFSRGEYVPKEDTT